MANPTRYELSYDFTGFQTASPLTPLPADKIEIEFNNLQQTTDEIINNLTNIQRSDGALTNGIVTYDSLNADVKSRLGGTPSEPSEPSEPSGGDTGTPRLVTTTSTTFIDGETFIAFNSSVASAKTLTLGVPSTTQVLTVKDAIGSAGTHNISINASGCTIDGISSKSIDMDYGVLSFKWDGTSNWMVF